MTVVRRFIQWFNKSTQPGAVAYLFPDVIHLEYEGVIHAHKPKQYPAEYIEIVWKK